MRIDKFLKVSRIIKRRTVANEACDAGRVSIKVRIEDIKEHTLKNDAASLYTVLDNN